MPAWFTQLTWSEPVPVTRLVTGALDAGQIVAGAGLYVFSTDPAPLSPANVLYVGKADGARQTLRSRLGVYIRRLGRVGGKASRHAGLEQIYHHHVATPHQLFVRWCGCLLTRDVEGGLIDLFDPPYNNKGERLTLDDDERIPDIYLYTV